MFTEFIDEDYKKKINLEEGYSLTLGTNQGRAFNYALDVTKKTSTKLFEGSFNFGSGITGLTARRTIMSILSKLDRDRVSM